MTSHNLREELEFAQQAPADFAAFGGGGVKVRVYPGVCKALKVSGAIDALKAVAGSSAGALTAAIVATGIDPEKFEEITRHINFRELLGKGVFLLNKDGAPLYELLQKNILQNIREFLNPDHILEIAKARLEEIKEEQLQIGKQREFFKLQQNEIDDEIKGLLMHGEILDNPSSTISISKQLKYLEAKKKHLEDRINILAYSEKESNVQAKIVNEIVTNQSHEFDYLRRRCMEGGSGKIYFGDLTILRSLNPKIFKDLVVTAVRKDNGELTIFSPEKTPNVEIALACRASASIPVVFKPAVINGIEYVDGGYRDNLPTKYFKKTIQKSAIEDITDDSAKVTAAKKAGRMLAFVFSNADMNSPVNLALYSADPTIYKTNRVSKFLQDVLFKFIARVGGRFKYTETVASTYESLRPNALNVIPLYTKGISTLSFDEAQKRGEYLTIKGYINTMQHMRDYHSIDDKDKLLPEKTFLLKIYEKIATSNGPKSWVGSIGQSRGDKAAELLAFCKSEKWGSRDKLEVLKEYVMLAATNRRTKKLDCNTGAMKELLATLNDPSTPNQIKTDFIALLKGRKFTENIDVTKFKFEKADFKEFLSQVKVVKVDTTTHARTI